MSDASDSEQNNSEENEVSSEEIVETPTKNISSIFKELKENIEIVMESNENEKQKISELLSSVQIPYMNKTSSNYFFDILESLRKKKLLDSFVSFLKIKRHNKFIRIIKEAFLKELNILSKIKKENSSLYMIKFIVGNFAYQLNKKDKKKLENFLNLKYEINNAYIEDILTMITKTKNIYTIYICGLCFSIKSDKFINEKKKDFENIFTSFLSEEIFNDENKEINLAKLRILLSFINNLSSETFFDKIINECGRLLSRSSKNYEFLSTVIIGTNKIFYKDEFIKEFLFKEHMNYLFPTSFESNYRTDEIFRSFKNIVENSNLTLLLEEILKSDLEKNELYMYSYYFISLVFKTYSINKDMIKKYPIKDNLLVNIIIYILDNFDKVYNDSPERKKFINNFFQDFLSSLYCISPISIEDNLKKEKSLKISKILNELIKNNQYSNYHNYFYLFPAVLIEKYNFIFDDLIYELFLSLLNDNYEVEITEENSPNILPLATCSLNLGIINNNFKEKSKEKLNKVFINMVNSDLFKNNYNSLSQLESICLYLISKFLSKGESSFTEDETNYDIFLKLLSKAFFKGRYSNNEIIIFEELIKTLIENKEIALKIIDITFNFVLNLKNDIYTNNISFKRVAIFLDKFSEKYFDENFFKVLDKDIYLKLMILLHIPNMNLDINISNKKSHKKNMFIEKYYKNENKKKLVIDSIENNIGETLSPFIFSKYGVFNTNNLIIVNSCYSLITKIFQETKVSNLLLENSFGLLNYEKFKKVNDELNDRKKNIDYLTKYELIDLVNTLKKSENEIIDSFDIQTYKIKGIDEEKKEEEEKEEEKEEEEEKEKVINKKNKKGKNKKIENKKTKEINKKEEIKINEEKYKEFIFVHCYKLCNHMILILKRLKPILNHLNNFSYYNSKENIKYTILKLWPLLKIEYFTSFVKRIFKDYFRGNNLSKRFTIEFSELMNLESENDDKLFADNYKENQILISKFNRKLKEIFAEKENEKGNTYMKNLFNFYDFIIIRLLFYIILNKGILMDDVIESVENLINILQNLNSLNYEDISVLLVPLLKSNYYGENMKTLLELYFKNASEKSFINLCKELLNYEYISKYSFMNSILNENMSCIKNYQFIHYKIFILCYDENDNLSKLAKEIWSKFNLQLDDKFTESEDFKLATEEHKANDMVNRAIREYVHRFKSKFDEVLNYLLEFYKKEISRVNEEWEKLEENEENDEEDDENNDNEDNKLKKLKDPMIRKYLFFFINETLDLMNSDKKKELLDFFMNISDEEYSEIMFDEMNKSIFNLINSIPENDIITKTLMSIKDQILDISKYAKDGINYNNLKIIMMMLHSVLVRILHDKTFTKEREILFDVLLSLSQKLDNKDVFILLSKNIEYLASDIPEKSSKTFDELIQKIISTEKKLINFGDIYCLSGIIKCFGISSYKEKKLDEIIKQRMSKKSSVEDKQNAMYIIKIFFETMKKLYEPYFVEIFDSISMMIANREKNVRKTAQECFKGMMKELSGYGVDKIMPNLIKDLHSMNSKGKMANIEILGQFAYCAPKQLSIYIPKIIKEIMKVLIDPQKDVQETAYNVLNDIASTIKNPEIVDNADILIKAIQNPFESSRNALEMLMETEFYHYLDPPSLAIIIPILDYNLKSENSELKRMSAHILGSIQVLIKDQTDLIQYIDIIVPDIKIALFDSDPNCRNEISKAVGALTKSLGPTYLAEMMKWLESFLEKDTDTVRRSGAAQGYAEILVSFEESYTDKCLMKLINKIQDGNHIVKEGYLSVFVFMPGCLGDKFEKYFELIFPLIIECFSDEHENVRNVSNKIFEICIKIFAKKNTTQLVEPLLDRLFSENWRIRNSSIALIKTLISSLGAEFSKENSEYFKKELRDKILTYTFILKSDTSGNTETLANMIWRDYVDNIPKYLSKILVNIYEQLMNLINDEMNEECYNIARANVGLLATKFSDKFFNELLPIIKDNIIKEKNNEYITDASFIIIYVAITESSIRLLSSNRNYILKIMYENIFTEFSSVRIKIADIVYEMANRLNDHNMKRNLVNNVMKQARGKPSNVQKQALEIVGNLTEISKADVIRYVIIEIFKTPYEEGFFDLGTMISGEIVESIDDMNDAKNIFESLYNTFISCPKMSLDTVVAITSKLEEQYFELFIKFLEKIDKKIKKDKLNNNEKEKINDKESLEYYFSELIANFCSKTEQSLESIYDNIVEIIIGLFHYDNEFLIKNIGNILKTLVERTEKTQVVDIILTTLLKCMNQFYDEIKGQVEYNEEKFESEVGKKLSIILEHLLFTIQNELLYGNDKILACKLINDIIHYIKREKLKPYIMKLIGPIIRILGEKISLEIKEKLLQNTENLIIKVKEDIKGVSPQLQSVFLKALGDNSDFSGKTRVKAGENIILLLKYYPRLDVTANDLLKILQNKIDQRLPVETLMELNVLSDVIRFYGKKLKQDTIVKHFNTIKMWLETHDEMQRIDLIILLSTYIPYVSKDLADELEFPYDTMKDSFKIMEAFNGDIENFDEKIKFFYELAKKTKLQFFVDYLDVIGQIVKKYNTYMDINPEENKKKLDLYNKTLVDLFTNQIKLKPTEENKDALLCIFFINLGYIKEYETNKKFFKVVMNYLLKLMENSKVNYTIIMNCFTILVLKKEVAKPNKDELLDEVRNIFEDENEINIIETFIKKCFYTLNK